MWRHSFFFLAIANLFLAGCAGCTYEVADDPTGPAFVLGDLVEPFDPPTMDELDAMVAESGGWKEGPIIDGMQRLRERQDSEEVLASVEEALALKNDSLENNAKIASALGRLPADESDVDYEASIVRHVMGDVKSINPLMISSTAEFDVAALIGENLFGFDSNFIPFANQNVVTSWEISNDGMYDRVTIRDDLTWSDLGPLTAHDVEFSFNVIMSSQVPVPAVRSGTDQLKYVKAYDDHTVVFFHKKPLATNVWNINFPIIAKHVFQDSVGEDPTLEKSKYHVQHDARPVVAGMYIIERRERLQEIVLKRRESYYMYRGKQVRAKPHFKEVRIKIIQDPSTALLALKKGDIEEMQITPEQWQTQTDDEQFYSRNTKEYGLEWVYFYLGWNCKTAYFSDRRVRQAMSFTVDHQRMIQEHRFGLDQPCTGIFHPTSQWCPKPAPTPYQQDFSKAEKLLAEAGWEDHDGDGILDKEIDGDLVKFEFTLLVSNRADRIDLCNMFRENLDQLGIICNVRPMEFTVLQDRNRNHRFQASFGGWGTGTDPDASDNLWTTKAIDAGRNYVQYSNPVVDDLFEQGKTELDPVKRAAIYAKIHLALWEDQPYTWLYFQNSYYGFSKELRGFNFSPRGPYHYSPGFDSIWKPAMH